VEQWRTVICRFRPIWAGVRRPVSAGLLVILTLLVLISGQAAQACPPGMEHGMHGTNNTQVSVAHKPGPAATIASTVAPSTPIASRSSEAGDSGASNADTCPCGCQTGCCTAGAAVIDIRPGFS
jgi:hypothetical protein